MHANVTAKQNNITYVYQTELELVKRIEVLTEIITLQHHAALFFKIIKYCNHMFVCFYL